LSLVVDDDENFTVHVLFVDALFWVADSSGEAGSGGSREVGGEEGGLVVEDDNDIVSLAPIVVVVDCANESGKLIKFGYIKIKVSDSIITIMMNLVVLCDIFSLSCLNIMLIFAAHFGSNFNFVIVLSFVNMPAAVPYMRLVLIGMPYLLTYMTINLYCTAN
jgi:hypothetical protein